MIGAEQWLEKRSSIDPGGCEACGALRSVMFVAQQRGARLTHSWGTWCPNCTGELSGLSRERDVRIFIGEVRSREEGPNRVVFWHARDVLMPIEAIDAVLDGLRGLWQARRSPRLAFRVLEGGSGDTETGLRQERPCSPE